MTIRSELTQRPTLIPDSDLDSAPPLSLPSNYLITYAYFREVP